MKELKMYRCPYCGNMVLILEDGGVVPVCCGSEMETVEAGTTDGATEKHVPVVEINDGRLIVRVGSEAHPMTGQHYIEWIAVLTENGLSMRRLKPGDEAKAEFCIPEEKALAAYEYCNIHGLWKKEV